MSTCLIRLMIAVVCLCMGLSEVEAQTVSSVAAGYDHTCAVTSGGGVKCWGANGDGQLGDGTLVSRSWPVNVIGLTNGVAAVAVGRDHTCALTTAGGVKCWGKNNFGQIGDRSTAPYRTTPVDVVGLTSGVVAVSTTYDHTCAVTSAGGVKCWGRNDYGQLGDNTTTWRSNAESVFGLTSGITAVAAGFYHTCAVNDGGVVKCWGNNDYGAVGDGTTVDRLTPSTGVSNIGAPSSAASAGAWHSCARTTFNYGGAWCWGYNYYGQLGNNTTVSRSTAAVVSGLASGVAAVAAGGYHTCALTTDGRLMCWGFNVHGQLGDGTTTNQATPGTVAGLASGVTAVSAGYSHTCAVTGAGAVLCWGSNTSGQLGDSTTTTRLTPVRVVGLGPGATSDLTGDGLSDVVWRHATRGDVWVWPMNGAAKAAELYVRTVSEAGWAIRGLHDQTGDGQADVLWRHAPTGMIYLWTMSGNTVEAETYVGTVDPAYDVVGTGDYNGDGKSDILWRHLTNGELWVWLMNGATAVSATYVTTVDPGYAVVGSGDLNGDGRADLVWRHKTGGGVWVWLMNGTTPTSMTYVTTVPDLGYQVVGVADHTGDGKADILWHHNTGGDIWLWPMSGATLMGQQYVGSVPDTGYRIVGTGDYNGDTKADILWHHATRGEVWVWLMNGVAKLSENYVATVPDTGYQIVR